MQKLVIRMSQVCLFFTLLCLSFQPQAATFVDLNEVTFSEGDVKRKALRLVLFDIRRQEYSYIGYYPLDAVPPPSGIVSSPAPQRQLPLDLRFIGIKVFHDGAQGTIEVEGEHKARYITRVRDVLQGTITPKTPQNIREILRSYNGSIQTPSFKAITYALKGDKEKKFMAQDEREFTKLSPDKDTNSRERGVLGELATEMTMISFQCTRHFSQNASNQGFDGVYTTSGNTGLFLTESKCWQDPTSAEVFMGKDLNEERIYGKLQAIKAPYLGTKALIEGHIAETPQNIFKVVHRIKPNGRSQYCVQQFDLFLYKVAQPQSALISGSSSPLHKQLIFEALRKRIIGLDLVSLVEGISGLSKEEIGASLMKYLPPISDGGGEEPDEISSSASSSASGMSHPSTPPKPPAQKGLSSPFNNLSLKDKGKEAKAAPAAPPPGQPADPLSDVRKKEAVVFASHTLPKLKTLISLNAFPFD